MAWKLDDAADRPPRGPSGYEVTVEEEFSVLMGPEPAKKGRAVQCIAPGDGALQALLLSTVGRIQGSNDLTPVLMSGALIWT